MWRTQHQSSPERTDGNIREEIRSVREPGGKGTQNPLLIATEELIRRWIAPEVRDDLEDREGCGIRWIGKTRIPQYERLGGSEERSIQE